MLPLVPIKLRDSATVQAVGVATSTEIRVKYINAPAHDSFAAVCLAAAWLRYDSGILEKNEARHPVSTKNGWRAGVVLSDWTNKAEFLKYIFNAIFISYIDL